MKQGIVLLILVGFLANLNGQESFNSEEEFQEQYQINILKTHLDGVYIPANMEEAFKELKALSTDDALVKFKNGPEDLVSKRLHFGLGRWMAVNWKFYTGSRLSHSLKQKGLLSPDHMSQFMIRSFHRHLNEKPLDEAGLVANLKTLRAEELKEALEKTEVLKEETRKIPRGGN